MKTLSVHIEYKDGLTEHMEPPWCALDEPASLKAPVSGAGDGRGGWCLALTRPDGFRTTRLLERPEAASRLGYLRWLADVVVDGEVTRYRVVLPESEKQLPGGG